MEPLETLIQRLEDIISEESLGYTERFERNAERFYKVTGHLAPGKSAPLEMYTSDERDQERQIAWTEWNDLRTKQFYATLRWCVSALNEIPQGEMLVEILEAQIADLEAERDLERYEKEMISDISRSQINRLHRERESLKRRLDECV